MNYSFEQLPKESAKAFEAFSVYLKMGSQRSLEAVARKLAKSTPLLKRWSAKFDWPARVLEYGAHMATVEREAAESLARRKGVDWAARQEEHREEEWRVRGELLAMGREAVERWRKNAARCGSLEGIARLMELASKLGRLSSGMPTDCTQTKGELDVTVDVEFEAALKKAYGVLADGHNADGHAAIGKTIEAEIVGQKTLPEVSHD
jgi:hypothetical protein